MTKTRGINDVNGDTGLSVNKKHKHLLPTYESFLHIVRKIESRGLKF